MATYKRMMTNYADPVCDCDSCCAVDQGKLVETTARRLCLSATEFFDNYVRFCEAKERQREAAKEKNSAGDGTGFGPSVAEPLNSAERQARASRTKAAKAVGTSADSVAKAKKIANRAPDLLEKVQKDEISLNKANEIVKEREQEKREKEAGSRTA